ncbi:hypothetical protein JCM8547_001200 [Rhodosporidiobolus lusitaniae]
MATAAVPPANPRQTNKPSSRRIFRSFSRFLSGGNKQRPKLPHQNSDDIPPTTLQSDTTGAPESRTPSRSRSRSSSVSGGEDGHDDEHRLPTPRRGSGSLSNRSGFSGADTDASIYPISPSTRPPSSIMSKQTAHTLDSASIASFAPTHGGSTYAKSYASTKPTTLLSIDSAGGANRIAVVPGTGSHFLPTSSAQHQSLASPAAGMSTSPSGNSLTAPASPLSTSSNNGPGITFSSLPTSSSPGSNAASSSAPPPPFLSSSTSTSSTDRNPYNIHPSLAHHRASTSSSSSSLLSGTTDGRSPGVHRASGLYSHVSDSPTTPHDLEHDGEEGGGGGLDGILGIPAYTFAHPRNNPHPQQPPPDNASVLTLASSSFAPSFIGSGAASTTTAGGGGGGREGRGSWAGGGLKAWSTKQARSLGGGVGKGREGGGAGGGADEDASVRALAGSRRPSEESLGARSTWSAVVLNNTGGAGSIAGGKEGTGEEGVRTRKERQASVLSRSTAGVEAEEGGAGEGGEREKERRRRSSLTTLATGCGEQDAPVASPDLDGDGAGDEVAVEEDGEEDREGKLSKEEKGKGVDDAEHTGIVESSSSSSPPRSSLSPTADAFVPSSAAPASDLPPPNPTAPDEGEELTTPTKETTFGEGGLSREEGEGKGEGK